MDIGLSLSIFGKKTCVMGGQAADPAERHFAQCAEYGIRHVEVIIMEGYLEPGDWAAVDRVGEWAARYGVTINSVHGPSGWPTNGHWLGDPDEAARRRNVQERLLALEGARRLSARYLIVEFEGYGQWPFWPHLQPPTMVFPEAIAQWRRSFAELLPAAAAAGVRLAIENVDGVPNAELAEIMAGTDPGVAGVCFDSSHATYGGDFFGQLALLAPYVIGTHLSDNDGLPGVQYSDRHWRPFTGAIDWPRLVRELRQRSRCECLILEVLNREDPQITPALVAACREIAALAQQSAG